MDASRSRRAPRSHDFLELRGGMRRIRSDLHSRTDVHGLQKHAGPGIPQNGGGIRRRRRCFAATDCSDFHRLSFGCPPGIEGIITQYPPNTRGFPRHVNGKRRSSSWQSNIGIEASSEASGRQNRAEVLRHYGDAGLSSLHASNASGWFTPASRIRRMPPAGDAGIAQHESANVAANTYIHLYSAGPYGRLAAECQKYADSGIHCRVSSPENACKPRSPRDCCRSAAGLD